MTTGVRPAITLARASGIPCARGIVVDGQLRSAVAGVSALGECCEIAGQTRGLVAPCLQQAEILAARLLGTPEADFHWQAGGLRLKVTGIDLFSAGDVQARDGDDIWTSLDPLSGHYRRLLVRENRLCGVLLLGDCASAAALTERLNTPEPPQAGWLFDSFTAQPAAAGIPKMTKPTLVVVGHGMVGHHF